MCVCVELDHPALCPLTVSYQPSFTAEWISRVKFHQILNENAEEEKRRRGGGGSHPASGNPPCIISPLFSATPPRTVGGWREGGFSGCKGELLAEGGGVEAGW